MPYRVLGAYCWRCVVLLIGLAGLLLTGCGADRSGADRLDSALDQTALDLLTRAGGYSYAQYVLSVAEQQLIKACMAESGYPYLVDPPTEPIGTDEDRALQLAERRRTGYGLYAKYFTTRESSQEQTNLPANDQYVRQLSEPEQTRYMSSLEGSTQDQRAIRLTNGSTVTFAAGGCQGKSYQILYGDAVTWAKVTYVPQALNVVLTHLLVKDPRYESTIQQWASCMSQRGHQASSPDDAQTQLKDAYQREGPYPQLHQHEIDVAVADAECAATVHLPSLILSLKRELAQALPAGDRQDLVSVAKAWAIAMTKAQEI